MRLSGVFMNASLWLCKSPHVWWTLAQICCSCSNPLVLSDLAGQVSALRPQRHSVWVFFFLFMLHKSGTKRRSYTTSLVSNHSSGLFMFLFFYYSCCCCVIYILLSPLLFYSFYSLMWLSIVSALLCVLPKDLWIERCFRNNLASFLYHVTQTTDPVAPWNWIWSTHEGGFSRSEVFLIICSLPVI